MLCAHCVGIVTHFALSKDITDNTLKRQVTEDFYQCYCETITVNRPPSYNFYTGMMIYMGNTKFLKQLEDIVHFDLGLTWQLPEELRY